MAVKALLLFLSILMGAGTAPTSAAASGPKEQVKVTVDGILAILRDKTSDWYSKQLKIETIIDSQFDFQTMSQSVLATNWTKATPEERKRFVEFFSQYLQHTYTDQMKRYTDEHVKYGGEKITGDRAKVETFIISQNTRIPVTYKLRRHEGKWFAYDVVIEGVSLVSNYRTTYSGIVKTEGIGGLLDSLQGSIDKYKRERDAKKVR